MNTQTENNVRATVSDWVGKGYLFTAFDVTQKVRNDGDQLFHSESKTLIDSIFQAGSMPSYDRTSVDIGRSVNPFVYHNNQSNANSYDINWLTSNPTQNGIAFDGSQTITQTANSGGYTPLSQLDLDDDQDTPVSTAVPAAQSPVIQDATVSSLPKGSRVTTKEGRLQIPTNLIRTVGWYQGLMVFAEMNGSSLILSKNCSGLNSNFRAVKVNKDGRIRICKRILKNTIGIHTSYKVDRTNGNIVVSK